MRREIAICIMLIFGSLFLANGQTSIKDNKVEGYWNEPIEAIFIHLNTSLLLAGERLYYKAYILNSKTENLSTLSKIAYVELIDKEKKTVFKHKLRLTSGMGKGDFLVPTDVPTGNYKLLGYTQWMKNDGQNHLFQGDIGIINPYLENQNVISAKKDGIANLTLNDSFLKISRPRGTKHLSLSTDSKVYEKRSHVSISLKSLLEGSSHGNYSISVRKMDDFETNEKPSAESFMKVFEEAVPVESKTSEIRYLPELRGELISGRVLRKDTNSPAKGKRVSVSIPGEDFVLKVGNTNESGIFFFNLDAEYSGMEAVFQVLGLDHDQYIIELSQNEPMDIENLSFENLVITDEMKDLLLERSIFNQVENAYVEVKSDSIRSFRDVRPFYRNLAQVYNLDDYTRFPTVQETIVEVIDHVWFRKNNLGEYVFQVRGYDSFTYSQLLPLVIVDGVLVQRHQDLVEYSTKNVQKIGLFRERFRIGPQVFQGMVAIETKLGDFKLPSNEEFIKLEKLFKPLPEKHYFKQSYSAATKMETERIPDFRHQLLWEPDFKLTSDEIKIDFFTSDVTGNFEICLEGFTFKGEPISLREVIQVE